MKGLPYTDRICSDCGQQMWVSHADYGFGHGTGYTHNCHANREVMCVFHDEQGAADSDRTRDVSRQNAAAYVKARSAKERPGESGESKPLGGGARSGFTPDERREGGTPPGKAV